MATPTPTERRAYSLMQARMLALLLRFSSGEYRKLFAKQEGFQREPDVLEIYRDLGVLFHLRDELFEHILPRILRRLSFVAPRRMVVEEPPGRGRIDWERTLAATWAERPGEPPLELHGRQSLRDFATPENLLVVATLLEYRADVRRILLSDAVGSADEALRHPLQMIVERCERELAFPQLAGIRATAQQILEGAAGGVESLGQRVAQGAIPGGNSAYDDLLAWRRRYRELGLLQRLEAAAPDETLGVNPRRDNRLYQLWIVCELADLLLREGKLIADATALPMRIGFRWGAGDDERRYELLHDRGIPEQPKVWRSEPTDGPVPGVRPDYYLRRIDPPMTTVGAQNDPAWREPGVIWDAKYYRERDRNRAPGEPVKRMLADLALTGERCGSLLFAFLRAEPGDAADVAGGIDGALVQRLQPLGTGAQQIDPETQIAVLGLCPDQPTEATQRILAGLLDQAHVTLRTPLRPTCQGIFLDALSAEGRRLVDRWDESIDAPTSDLLICPKPHIGPWRIDLVSRKQHCCSDPRLCHIVGQEGAKRPVRPPRDARDLVEELGHIFEGDDRDHLQEEDVSAIARTVEGLTRHFADRLGVFRNIAVYENRLRDMGMERALDHLNRPERESLALALFLVEQLDSIGAKDFSAPAIHISSVLEIEIQRRVFRCPGLVGQAAWPKKQTLGLLPFMRWKPHETEGDWERIVAFVSPQWDGAVVRDDPSAIIDFPTFVKAVDTVAQLRNKAAHTHPVSRDEYRNLFGLVCQGGPLRIGALNVLVLAWRNDGRIG
ncbi:hypothetical protein K2Z83_18405 [Oscillochloris sp. ZM17-4]|uniref:hypothetical protein n=1 Tax=Oscillochloris sp. ZM17-4 TaxID=2866714 RepID=UPI001C72BC47|nr:hypothetical protein [Oscillochloris sp. ZM17-4]MBX0329646.1 hypothetical protein [Oscillochloris sp. ZM17-4]